LVWEGSPYSTNIEGNYKKGFSLKSSITKYSVNGYYAMSNCYAAQGYNFPVVMADNGDGKNFTIVPGEHPSLGKYFGYAYDSTNTSNKHFIIVKIKTVIPGQDTIRKSFVWNKI